MKLYNSLLTIITTSATFIVATPTYVRSNGNIPRSTQENLDKIALDYLNEIHALGDRSLQADFICNRIENAFNGDVNCDCSIQWTSMEVNFQCAFTQPVCAPETPAGKFCSQPRYSGKLMLRPLKAAVTLENSVCMDSISLTNSPVGDLVFGNLCVEADLCYKLGQNGSPICDCAATYGGLSCQCTPCTLPNGEPGVTLECLNVSTPLCIPLSFPQSASEANSVQPFIPLLTVHEE